jgi:hypothetical protein
VAKGIKTQSRSALRVIGESLDLPRVDAASRIVRCMLFQKPPNRLSSVVIASCSPASRLEVDCRAG